MTARGKAPARKPAKGQPTKGQTAKPVLARQGVAMAVSGVIGAATGAMAGFGAAGLGAARLGRQAMPGKGLDVASLGVFSKEAWAGFGRRMVGAPVVDGAQTGGAGCRLSRPEHHPAGLSAAVAGPPGNLKSGAARAFLIARAKTMGWAKAKAPFELSVETGVDAETLRKALRPDAYELSARNFSRLMAAYGPPFLAAVLDPVPAWVSAALAPPPVPGLPLTLQPQTVPA